MFLGNKNEEEIRKYNEGNLFSQIPGLCDSLSDPLVAPKLKNKALYKILASKDYAKHIGSIKLLGESIITDLEPDVYFNGKVVSHDYFEKLDQKTKEVFEEYWEQDSYVLDYIKSFKQENQNKAVERNAEPLRSQHPSH